MRRFITLISLFILSTSILAGEIAPLGPERSLELRQKLIVLMKKNKKTLYYKEARLHLFNEIYAYYKEGSENNFIRDIYCEVEYQNNVDIFMDNDDLPDGNVLNTEHTWPKSRFFDYGPQVPHHQNTYDEMVSDMHHLYPTDSLVNQKRGDHFFGEVDQENKGQLCEASKMGQNSKYPQVQFFEPPDEVKGDIARGLFYFAVMYELPIDDREEEFLRAWDKLDPISSFEKFRNEMVEKYQGNRNPFIDYPELIKLIPNL
ncbi:endonuclease I family protein [Halobacteriovorax sp. YZS-1-1]|uniref:endonuclease I family protein n=1 Tax=unclassified Halobacteriovorax TaxID=2639665 RepID=UPI00399B3651